jgi:hypothetical protein
MMNVRDYLLSLRVDVPAPAEVVAAQLLGGLGNCRCTDCKPLADWLRAPPSYGALNLSQCSTLIANLLRDNCDECLAYGQLINRRMGQVIHAAEELPASTAHALDEAQAIERDRLDSRRITCWFELSLACEVGAARARKLVLNVTQTPFTLSHLIEPHNDENGLTFDLELRAAVRYGAKVYLEHYGHLVKE